MGLGLPSRFSRSAEELIQEFVTTDAKVLGYIGEDPRQRADPQRCVVRDCDMMLSTLLRGETHVASVLSRDLVAQRPESTSQASSI